MESTFQQHSPTSTGTPWPMLGIGVVLLLVLATVLVARLTGYNAAPESAPIAVESRALGFRDLPQGRIEIYHWDSGEVLQTLETGEGSFVRGVVRSLVRQRRGIADPSASPFILERYANGQLALRDPATGEQINLVAFGPTNQAAFASLMSATPALETGQRSP